MILVIGGYASGKRQYVKSQLGYKDTDISDGVIDEHPVVYNLQDIVSKAPGRADELFCELEEKQVVVCNEVGCGLVPVSAEERIAREVTGRLCVKLAQKAQRVVRMQCGIASVIKG